MGSLYIKPVKKHDALNTNTFLFYILTLDVICFLPLHTVKCAVLMPFFIVSTTLFDNNKSNPFLPNPKF